MKRDAEYLKTLAQQVEDGLITLAEAMDLIAGNENLTDELRRPPRIQAQHRCPGR